MSSFTFTQKQANELGAMSLTDLNIMLEMTSKQIAYYESKLLQLRDDNAINIEIEYSEEQIKYYLQYYLDVVDVIESQMQRRYYYIFEMPICNSIQE